MNEDSMKELERLRKQISQQEKMTSLGLLSAGIAHEIQNPLNFVINFSKLSCKLLQDMEDVLDELESKLSAEVDEEIRENHGRPQKQHVQDRGKRQPGIEYRPRHPALFPRQRR